MMRTLRDVLDPAFEGIKFNKALANAAYKYQLEFLSGRQEYLDFFSSNLIGVHAIRFRTSDTLKFYRQVAHVDYATLEKDLKKVTTIEQKFKISSNAMNLTLMYLLHRFATSPDLSEKDRERAMYDIALIFFYRCIAIRQSEYFNFPADPRIAQAAYADLSKKFLIKELGSWKAVMEYRAKDLIAKDGLHYANLVLFNDDSMVVRAISYSENAIRDLYKNYCKVFYLAYKNGDRIVSSSSTMMDAEGIEKLKEKVGSTEQYINYLRTTVADPNSFVKDELVRVIIDINTNTSYRMVVATLTWLSENYNNPKYHLKIDQFLSKVIIHSFFLLKESGSRPIRDYPSMLLMLKNLYLSTRSSDKDLLDIRKTGQELIKAANGPTNASLAMATRTAVILYVTLRALVSRPG